MHIPILILGGGITGLSTAYHLERAGRTDYLLLEKEPFFGGLCASTYRDGFTLDFGGHLLHLHTPQGEALVRALLGDNLLRCERRAWVFTHGRRVPFPFQANLWALPEDVRARCVQGLLRAAQNPPAEPPQDFQTWCLAAFGQGIYDEFMRPYNEKLWGLPPRELTCDWCGPFVPLPAPEQIAQSAQRPPERAYGYNAHFYYPRAGGIGALTAALAQAVSRKRARAEVTRIDLARKTAQVGGETFSYDTLVSTIPLPVLARLVQGVPELRAQADALRARAVSVLHLAVARETEPFSWIYFAEKQFPFYRVGLQSGFSPANAPRGTSLFYVEFAGEVPPALRAPAHFLPPLTAAGILRADDKILLAHWQTLPHAYAVYDKRRGAQTARLLRLLADRNCLCAGRYGRWEYSFMEHNLCEGAQLAQKLV